MVEARYPLYRHPTAPRDHRPHLHDTYLQLAAEYGVLALIAFVAILVASLRQTLLNYRREGGARGPRADLHLGVAAALVAYTLAAFFEDNWADTEVQKIALFIIALPFCLDCRSSTTVNAWPNSSSYLAGLRPEVERTLDRLLPAEGTRARAPARGDALQPLRRRQADAAGAGGRSAARSTARRARSCCRRRRRWR